MLLEPILSVKVSQTVTPDNNRLFSGYSRRAVFSAGLFVQMEACSVK